jgi:tetratricopeptide (TPR) repeat protein
VPRAATLSLLAKAEGLFDDMAQYGRPTPELRYRKAWMLIQFARNYEILGDTGKQFARANEAYRLLVGLAAEKSDDIMYQRDLSVAYDEVGNVLVAQGDLTAALQAYRDSLAIFERLAKADPGNAGWQRDLSVSYNKVGDVLVEQGDLTAALQAYREDLAIAERLAKADPSNAGWQRDLQTSIGKIGNLAYNFVLARQFDIALEAADQAIALAPEETWLYTIRAHALMFLYRVDEARALYLKYRGATNVSGDESWEVVILEDFAELRKAGLSHPLMDEIESKFTKSG